MPYFDRHIFVCTNERAPDDARGCCQARGGSDVRLAFAQEIKSRGLSSSLRANKAGCMDACEHGVVVTVYPDNVWYGGVTVKDVPEIMEKHILGGQPVERLVIPKK